MIGKIFVKDILTNKKTFYIILSAVFLLAVILRLDLYFFNRSFWFDEAALAINVMNSDFKGLFGALSYFQSTPPLFLFETKILADLFGTSELIFRFIPLAVSLLLLPLFYFYSKYFLKSRTSRLLALFLFAINTNLIFYSTEFKPYALDVCASIVLPILILKMHLKKPIFLGIIFALFPWYSYGSGIVELGLVVFLFAHCLKYKKNLKNFFKFLAPQIINIFLFALHLGATESSRLFLTKLWSASYISKNLSNFWDLYLDNIFYIFHPYKTTPEFFPYLLPLIIGIACILGAVFLFRANRFKFYLLLSPYFALLLLAYLSSYPYYDRVTLFLTPIFLILFVRALAPFLKKPYGWIIFLAFVVFSIYPFITSQNVMKNLPSQDLDMFLVLREKYKRGDIIMLNQTSIPQFLYYSKRYHFLHPSDKNIRAELIQISSVNYLAHLNSLDKDKNYWFFISSIRFPSTVETRDLIEFWGRDWARFIHYNKGKTDLYYVGK